MIDLHPGKAQRKAQAKTASTFSTEDTVERATNSVASHLNEPFVDVEYHRHEQRQKGAELEWQTSAKHVSSAV